MNHVFLIRRCHDFSHILSYFLSALCVECGLLWVFCHHSAFHEDAFHMRPAGFDARPFRQFIHARTTKSCWIWLPPSSCAAFLRRPLVWPLCSNALILCARPSWQCGWADVSPEEERFKLAQACPPGLCAGASSSCGVRVHPSGGVHSSGVGEGGGLPVLLWHLLQHWLAFGPRAAAGHESHAPR